jgi:hypothetical protein
MEPLTILPQLSKHQQVIIPMQTLSKAPCEHIYLRQTILAPTLPPLYVANPTPPPPIHFSVSSFAAPNPGPISPFLIAQLKRVHDRLGPKKIRSPFLARDIARLQWELGGGMTRARRQQVEVYVAGIRDPWRKACAELYLARYPGFVMRGDGRLDYGTRGRDEEIGGRVLKGKWDCGEIGGCGVM